MPPETSDLTPSSSVPSSSSTPVETAAAPVAPMPAAPAPQPMPAASAPVAMLPEPHHPSMRAIVIIIVGLLCFIAAGVAWYLLVWRAQVRADQAAKWEQTLKQLPENPAAQKLTTQQRQKLLDGLHKN